MPADAIPGSTTPEDTEAEVLLRDGTWTWRATFLASYSRCSCADRVVVRLSQWS
jgi:hypothetical protein